MSKVIIFTHLTLDGVMQAPGRADEDRRGGFEHGGWAAPRGGFEHGGWAAPRGDSVIGNAAGQSMGNIGGLLLGRRTYADFYAYWPNQPEPNPFTAVLNNCQKYVASRTLQEPLSWSKSTLLKGERLGRARPLAAARRPGQSSGF